MLNHIVIMGRLTKDPELRYTASNIPVVSFSIAVERDFGKNESGEKVTDFFDVTAWRQTAEFINKFFTKGRMIVVSGSLQTRKWEAKDGTKRTAYEIVADNVYFGDSKSSREDGGDYGRSDYGSRGGYQDNGGYQQRSSRQDNGGSYRAPSRDSFESARQQARDGGFAEMDGEDDGDLPF